MDRHRDFRAVLVDGGATPEQCRRVLWEILGHSGWFLTPVRPNENLLNLDNLFVRLGKQDFGRWLYTVLAEEPREVEHES